MIKTTARILEVNPGRAVQKKRRRVALCWAGNKERLPKSATSREDYRPARNTPSARSEPALVLIVA